MFSTPLRKKIFGTDKNENYVRIESIPNVEGVVIVANGEKLSLSLTKPIGKGSFGTVWLGKIGDIQVATKQLDRTGDGKGNGDAEYKKELDIMSELNSPYVVHVYGSFETKKSFFIVMEYVPLGSLGNVFSNNTFSSYMKCRFMLDVARGMEYLHEQGIVHRDLKPGNVLVASLDPKDEVLCKYVDIHLVIVYVLFITFFLLNRITDFGESRKGLEDTHTLTILLAEGKACEEM